MEVYYLGPEGSYSHVLARQLFNGAPYQLVPLGSFPQIYQALDDSPQSFALLPVENSITSNVHENIDYLFNSNLKIVGEANLAIHLHLVGRQGVVLTEIKTAYSHPKALEQCSNFLAAQGITGVPVESTGEGQQHLLRSPAGSAAVIGGRALANPPELTVIAADIGNQTHNLTRFVWVSPALVADSAKELNKVSLTFRARHAPGSLARILTALSVVPANLTKIESKPIPGSDWEYSFWLDLEVAPALRDQVIAVMERHSLQYRLVGIYQRGQVFES